MTSLQLYLINGIIELSSNIFILCTICMIISGILLVAVSLMRLNGAFDRYSQFDELIRANKFISLCKKITIYSALIALPFSFVPEQKTAIAIYLIPKIANNQSLQKIPDYINQWILKELKDNKS